MVDSELLALWVQMCIHPSTKNTIKKVAANVPAAERFTGLLVSIRSSYFVSITKKNGDVGELTILTLVMHSLKRLIAEKNSSSISPSSLPSS